MWDLSALQQRVEEAILAHAMNLTTENPNLHVHHINLYLPCTFFMLSTKR